MLRALGTARPFHCGKPGNGRQIELFFKRFAGLCLRVSKPMCWLIYMKWRYYVTNEEAAALPGHGAQKENEGSAAHSVGQGSERKRRRLREAGKSCEFDTGMMEERRILFWKGYQKL